MPYNAPFYDIETPARYTAWDPVYPTDRHKIGWATGTLCIDEEKYSCLTLDCCGMATPSADFEVNAAYKPK